MRLLTIVEDILRFNEKARDSDRELLIQVMQRRGMNLTDSQIDKLRDINFETITRCRRKLQEQGKYLPSPGVARQRRIKSMIFQQNTPQASPERIEQIGEQQAMPWWEGR